MSLGINLFDPSEAMLRLTTDFGQAFKARRLELGLSQRDAARHFELTQQVISHVETGLHSRPSLYLLVRLGLAVGCAVTLSLVPVAD